MMRLHKIGCTLGQSVLHSKEMMPSSNQVRWLFSREQMGILGYESTRQTVANFVTNKTEYKQNFPKEFMHPQCDLKKYENGLKNFIHVFENDQNDVMHLKDALLTLIQKQNGIENTKWYNFGPVLMRAFHYFNLPSVAIEFFEDETLGQLFKEPTAYQILLDLLYENEQYADVLAIYYGLNKDGRLFRHVRQIDVIVLATYYRLNTTEALEEAVALWNEIDMKGKQFQKSRALIAGLAVKQNKPELALKLLEDYSNKMYVTIRHIYLLAWAQIEQFDEVLAMLNKTLNRTDRQSSSIHVLNNLEKYFKENASTEKLDKFILLRKKIEEGDLVMNKTFDELMLAPFQPAPPGNTFMKKKQCQ